MTTVRKHHRCAAGYTLMELCCVVALIVLLGSLVVPYFNGWFSGGRIDAAGDMIMARMADARSMAMEQGKAFRFGFTPGTGNFQIAADDSADWQSGGSGSTIDTADKRTGKLPDGVTFTTEPGSASGGGGSGGGAWHTGGVFLPDGTARGGFNADGTTMDDVTFYFGVPGVATQGVRVRGITGTVRMFELTDSEANQP